MESSAIKSFARSETGIIIEALLAMGLVSLLFGFKAAVIGALAVIIGHVVKLERVAPSSTL